MRQINRSQIFPEGILPRFEDLVAEGCDLSEEVFVGNCPFLSQNNVKSEMDYKQKQMRKGKFMLHAQIGYRSLKKTKLGFAKIYEEITKAGYTVDRYGICLDWSMGYPTKVRASMSRGTGLILNKPEEFNSLTAAAPVAPHFGDFVIGTPASVENTSAALQAGATTIGNIGQYFNFRMPKWQDDIGTTAATVKALALCEAQPVEVMIHSNLDDGFAALFRDMSCSIGAVLIEKYIVEDLIGGIISHCYGHTFSEPLTRLAFLEALTQVTKTPGSMIYGNTTIYTDKEIENYANLTSYLLVDIIGQLNHPTGHGLNPVPVTEALHIPEISDIINAHLVANQLIQRSEGYTSLFDYNKVKEKADKLVTGGNLFKERVLEGLKETDIDIRNPFELLLAIRRIGARALENNFGPGRIENGRRKPIIKATTLNVIEKQGQDILESLNEDLKKAIRNANFTVCITCTDVHEYGKVLVEEILKQLDVNTIDAGVSTDTNILAEHAKNQNANFIAISTYSGVALSYLKSLHQDMERIGFDVPIFIGGKLTQIPDDPKLSEPFEVNEELKSLGAIVCIKVEDMLYYLYKTVGELVND